MQRNGPREHEALYVAPQALEIGGAIAVIHADDVLVDDRSVVQLLGYVVGGGTHELDALLVGAAIRIRAGEGAAGRSGGC